MPVESVSGNPKEGTGHERQSHDVSKERSNDTTAGSVRDMIEHERQPRSRVIESAKDRVTLKDHAPHGTQVTDHPEAIDTPTATMIYFATLWRNVRERPESSVQLQQTRCDSKGGI